MWLLKNHVYWESVYFLSNVTCNHVEQIKKKRWQSNLKGRSVIVANERTVDFSQNSHNNGFSRCFGEYSRDRLRSTL
jgi:hypothetical protein